MAWELLERERELEALESALSGARDGAGSVVVIEGPAGIGKTRLLTLTAELARSLGVEALGARASVLEREFSFGVVMKLLEDRVERLATEGGAGITFSGAAALARPLFGSAPHVPERPTGDSLFSLLHGLHWLIANLAEEAPLLLCVDDVQWADEPSLAFLTYLVQRVDELPVAIAIAVRTGEPSESDAVIAELCAQPTATVLRPASLSPVGTASRVRADFPGADDEFCDACLEASGGNPFYLRELLAAAAGDGIEPTVAGAARVAELGPESVSRAVLTRLGRSRAPMREVAEAISVLGDGVPLRYGAEVAGVELDDCIVAVDELVRADVFAPAEPISFAHPIVASAVYADIPPARRAQAHARAAEVLHRDGRPPEAVASHLLRASQSGEGWARRVLRDAAERAHGRGAPRAALRYLRRALEDGPGTEERGELLALAGLAESEAGEGSGTQTLAEAVGLIQDAQRRAQALFHLAFVLAHGGRYPDAAEAAERGRRELGEADPVLAGRLDALAAMSRTYVDLTSAEATARRIEASLERPRLEASAAGRAVLANASIGLAFAGAPAPTLHRHASAALRHGTPEDDPFDLAAYPMAAFGMVLAGDLEAADRACSAAAEQARRRGSILELGAAIHVRSLARFQAGRVGDALADAESAVETGRWGWGATLPMAHAQLVFALLELGEVDRAERALELPGGEARWTANVSIGIYLVARALVLEAKGERDPALDQLLLAGKLAELSNARHSALFPWRPPAVAILAASGQRERACELALEDLERAREFGSPGAIGVALRMQGIARGDSASLDLFSESERVLAESAYRLELARALVELGAARRREGSRKPARETLRRGLEIAHRCGSAVLVERAIEELRVAGARPRRPALTGVDSLTGAERRVARLAASGLSNREIAERLFVTRRTVEMHLTAVYGKLEIDSRKGLPEALDVEPEAPEPQSEPQ